MVEPVANQLSVYILMTHVDTLISTCFGASDCRSLCTLCPHDILDPDTKDQSGFRQDLFLLNS